MMRRLKKVLLLSLMCGWVAPAVIASEAPPNPWKEYDNPFFGIHMQIKRSWNEISIKDSPTTGSVAFTIRTTDPHSRVSVVRQKAEYPFEVWMSSEVLTQIYEPGYKLSGPVPFAGRSSMKVVGKNKLDPQSGKQETYYSNNPPFIDQITLSAPEDQWPLIEPEFAALRKSLQWTQPGAQKTP